MKPGRKQFDGKNKEIILQKLEQAFSLGCTDEEAYVYAGISKSAFYVYQQNHPEFLDRKEVLRAGVILRARKTIVARLDTWEHAWKYLERSLPEEFGKRCSDCGKKLRA